MVVGELRLRDFRCYEEAEVELGDRLTVITGANGAGKTNLLEGLYFGCTGRSCRTSNEREVIRFGARAARIELGASDEDGSHELTVGFAPGEPKRITVDGARVDRLLDAPNRPLVSVFLPDRLELVKGAPALRRAHLDHLIAALWPVRAGTRRAYAQTLAQRNALVARVRAGHSPRTALAGWDAQLAHHGIALMEDRARAVDALRDPFATVSEQLGLGDCLHICYRPRSRASNANELADEFADRIDSDLARGFTGHGPHRDELSILRQDRELRVYGSQGQQRVALLALLLAEREVIANARSAPPLMLLDDVMSELDGTHRSALVELLRDTTGQSVITTTDLDHIPRVDGETTCLGVAAGKVVHDALVA